VNKYFLVQYPGEVSFIFLYRAAAPREFAVAGGKTAEKIIPFDRYLRIPRTSR
jgi:hypothetical protein